MSLLSVILLSYKFSLILMWFVMEMPQHKSPEIICIRAEILMIKPSSTALQGKFVFIQVPELCVVECTLMQPLLTRSSSKYYIHALSQSTVLFCKYCRHLVVLSLLGYNLLHTQDRVFASLETDLPAMTTWVKSKQHRRGENKKNKIKKGDSINHSNSSSVYGSHNASDLPRFWLQTW